MVKKMKFPKENAILASDVKKAFNAEEYLQVYKMHQKVLENIDYFIEVDSKVLDMLITSSYLVGDTRRTIVISDEISKHGYESFCMIYYMILSYLCDCDIYQAMGFVKRSKLLKEIDVKPYLDGDEAHYAAISVFDNDIYKALSLVLCNFLVELTKESVLVEVIDKTYLLYRIFDVINLLNELGYNQTIVLKLSDDIRNVFISTVEL